MWEKLLKRYGGHPVLTPGNVLRECPEALRLTIQETLVYCPPNVTRQVETEAFFVFDRPIIGVAIKICWGTIIAEMV